MADRVLVRASDIVGLPVVTIDSGEDIAEIGDVVYDGRQHALVGFTLKKRSWWGGNLPSMLTASHVAAIGSDAVMIESEAELIEQDKAPSSLTDKAESHPVIGTGVLSAGGLRLGTITGVIVETGDTPRAVGYEITSSDASKGDTTMFVPISAEMALSDDNLIVPADVTQFVGNDLAGFGAVIETFNQSRAADSEVEA
jgi:uncharacterized protein YrrD